MSRNRNFPILLTFLIVLLTIGSVQMGLWARIQSYFGIIDLPPVAASNSTATPVFNDPQTQYSTAAATLAAFTPAPLAQNKPGEIRPIIAISGFSADSKSVAAAVAMVRAQGAEPLVITSHTGRNPAQDLAGVDGLVLLGNDYDIDPARYKAKADPHTLSEADPDLAAKVAAKKGRPLTDAELKTLQNVPARAAWETEALKIAAAQKIPLLGICGGLQRFTEFGATLHQDLPTLIGNDKHMQTEAPYVPVQPISIDKTSVLGKLGNGIHTIFVPAPGASQAEPLVLMENSFHHQAIDQVPQGFVASAHYADAYQGADGKQHMLIGALEPDPAGPYANQFLLGVQWHPEFGASELGPRIFQGLTDAAKLRAAQMANDPAHQAAEKAVRPAWMQNIIEQHEERQKLDKPGTKADAILPAEILKARQEILAPAGASR